MRRTACAINRRISKKTTQHRFELSPKQLVIETNEIWCPEQILIVCLHRNRRYNSKPKKLESSCTIACRRLVVWPDSLQDTIDFVTTLYKNVTKDRMEDKEWTLVLEGSMTRIKNGRLHMQYKPLAAIKIAVNSLIGAEGQTADVKLKLRPLHDGVVLCTLDLNVKHTLLDGINLPPSPATTLASTQPSPAFVRPIPVPYLATGSEVLNVQDTLDQLPILSPSKPEHKMTKESIRAPITEDRSLRGKIDLPDPDTMRKDWRPANGSKPDPAMDIDLSSTPLSSRATVSVALGHQESRTLPIAEPKESFAVRSLADNHQTVAVVSRTGNLGSAAATPIPPDQAEVEAFIAKLIASNRPNLTPTPRSSRASSVAPNHRNSSHSPTPAANNHNGIAMDENIKHLMDAHSTRSHQIQDELAQVAQKIIEIEQQDSFLRERMQDFEKGSDKETDLINHHLHLTGEKEQLSHRQDRLNAELDLNETEFKIAHLRTLLAGSGPTDRGLEQEDGSMSPRRSSSTLLTQLKEQMDHKNELVHMLSDMDEEEDEGNERSKRTLERTRTNFIRGQQEPLSASRRLMNWLIEQRMK